MHLNQTVDKHDIQIIVYFVLILMENKIKETIITSISLSLQDCEIMILLMYLWHGFKRANVTFSKHIIHIAYYIDLYLCI